MDVVRVMLGEEHAKELQPSSLSDNTVQRHKWFRRKKSSSALFAVQLDELAEQGFMCTVHTVRPIYS